MNQGRASYYNEGEDLKETIIRGGGPWNAVPFIVSWTAIATTAGQGDRGRGNRRWNGPHDVDLE